ncbi:MAG: hypothetical protein ACI9WC_003856 [Arenicella sp.]|jgi:hypothetical protein
MYIKLKSLLGILAVAGGGLLFLSPASAEDSLMYNEVPADNSHYEVGKDWSLSNGRATYWYNSSRTGYNVLDVSTRADCTTSGGCGSQTLSIGKSACTGFTLGVSFGGSIAGADSGLTGSPSLNASKTWTTCNTRSDSRSCPATYNKSVYSFVGVDRWLGNFLFEGNKTYFPNGLNGSGYDWADYQTGTRKYCLDQRGQTHDYYPVWDNYRCHSQRDKSSYRVVSRNWPRERFTDCRVRNIGTGFGSKTVTH